MPIIPVFTNPPIVPSSAQISPIVYVDYSTALNIPITKGYCRNNFEIESILYKVVTLFYPYLKDSILKGYNLKQAGFDDKACLKENKGAKIQAFILLLTCLYYYKKQGAIDGIYIQTGT